MMAGVVFASHAELAARRHWTRDECPGTLHIVDRNETFAFAICDGCPLEVAVPLRELDPNAGTGAPF